MEFSSRSYADIAVVAPAGRIDYADAAELQRVLAPLLDPSCSDHTGLVLDFAQVDYISSIGLRVLMDAAKQMRAQGRPIAVAALQPVVAEIFAISRFHNVLGVFPAVRAALAKHSAPALVEFDAVASERGR